MMEKTRHTDLEEQLDELSEAQQPGAFFLHVRELTRDCIAHGESHEDLYQAFEHYRSVLQRRGLERQEDELLEVMDLLHGWAPSHARI